MQKVELLYDRYDAERNKGEGNAAAMDEADSYVIPNAKQIIECTPRLST